jgi:hypothetical protein
MSELRLIDVNAAIYVLADMGQDIDTHDVIDLLKEQPTVDAVPVEWMKAKIESLKSQGNEFASLAAGMIQAMLNDYGAGGERR